MSAYTIQNSLALRALSLLGVTLEEVRFSAEGLRERQFAIPEFRYALAQEGTWLREFQGRRSWPFNRLRLENRVIARSPSPDEPEVTRALSWRVDPTHEFLRLNRIHPVVPRSGFRWNFDSRAGLILVESEGQIFLDVNVRLPFKKMDETACFAATYGFAAFLSLSLSNSPGLHDLFRREAAALEKVLLGHATLAHPPRRLRPAAGDYVRAFSGGLIPAGGGDGAA